MFVDWNTVALLRPEVVLIAAATSIFIGGAFTKHRAFWTFAAILAYLLAAFVLASFGWPWTSGSTYSGPATIDPMSLGLRWLAILMGLVFTLVVSRLAEPELASEFLGSLMLVVVGVMIVASANELVLLFLGLELISIPTYVLLFLGRRDRATAEATMKYFFLSIFSSALLLYGLTLLYGIGGTTVIAGSETVPGIREAFLLNVGPSRREGPDASSDVAAASDAIRQSSENAAQVPDGVRNLQLANPLMALAPLALVLVLAGLGFKLAVAPLQFYAPDVYQGTTNANAGLLAVAPKIAGVAGLVRIVIVALPASAEFAWQLAVVMAVLTMTIGNVCALWQSNVRRLMAYSSIAHGGYLLIGLATATGATAAGVDADLSGGTAAILFYVFVYALATMGTFAALAYLGSMRREVSGVEELAGLARSQPLVAAAIAVCMFSLAGIPPLAGFWGKLTLFGSAVQIATSTESGALQTWFVLLAVAGALNAAVAAAYYLRIVAVMYFQPATGIVAAGGGRGALAATLLCAALVLAAGAFPGLPIDVATSSERLIRPQSKRAAIAKPLEIATAGGPGGK